MTNAKALAERIGQTVSLRQGELGVRCIILDAKQAYGKTHYLVRPVEGDGEAWVDSSRIEATQ